MPFLTVVRNVFLSLRREHRSGAARMAKTPEPGRPDPGVSSWRSV